MIAAQVITEPAPLPCSWCWGSSAAITEPRPLCAGCALDLGVKAPETAGADGMPQPPEVSVAAHYFRLSRNPRDEISALRREAAHLAELAASCQRLTA